jgi:hypothetical protein
LRIISSKDVLAAALEGWNRHPHAEQPNPRKRSWSIHINSRLMAASLAGPDRVLACCRGTQRSALPMAIPSETAYWLIAGEKPLPSLGVAQIA